MEPLTPRRTESVENRSENRRAALVAAAYTLGPRASTEDVKIRASELLSWLSAR